MSAQYNARRVVESVVPVFIILSVIEHGVSPKNQKEEDDRKTLLQLLIDAMSDLLPRSLTLKEKQSLTRRIHYVGDELIIKSYVEEGKLAAKLGLVMYYFLKNMIELGTYNIVEGSNFDKALDMFLPGMQEWADKEAFNKSSLKEARKLLTKLQSNGYYGGMSWILDENGE